MALAVDVPITNQSIERFRIRARELRAEAELTTQPTVRQEVLETALAYERMAERGARFLDFWSPTNAAWRI